MPEHGHGGLPCSHSGFERLLAGGRAVPRHRDHRPWQGVPGRSPSSSGSVGSKRGLSSPASSLRATSREERSMPGPSCSGLASAKRFLVTFNGRAYDLNLLSSRHTLDPRTRRALRHAAHRPAAPEEGGRLPTGWRNARLVTIEAHVLGVRREDDAPGFDIPQCYFDSAQKARRQAHGLQCSATTGWTSCPWRRS